MNSLVESVLRFPERSTLLVHSWVALEWPEPVRFLQEVPESPAEVRLALV